MKCIKQNITNKTLYTKHFYAESQRIASKLGAGLASSIVDPTQFQVTEVCSNYEEKSDSLLQMLARGWDYAEIEPGNVSIENPELQVINELAEVSADEPESDIYYYHSDHLGSSSWITDAGGDVNQHLQYLPFGEDYIYQRNTSWNIPYTFSGKEKDAETGYSYFGARYYDSDISVWLSVDPMAFRYPYQSPYNYVGNRPINVIDPNGMWEKGAGFWRNLFRTDDRIKAEDRQAELKAQGIDASIKKNKEAGGWDVTYETPYEDPDGYQSTGELHVENFDKEAKRIRKKANSWPANIDMKTRMEFARSGAVYLSDDRIRSTILEEASYTGAIISFATTAAIEYTGAQLSVSLTPVSIIVAGATTAYVIETTRMNNEYVQVLKGYLGKDLRQTDGKGMFMITSIMNAGGNAIVIEKYYNAENGEFIGRIRR